ncbi:MAG TPA: hypothetical protein PLW65_34970, partial [Pseudomonadota bacterium]|nr:hypothetical protein [Pseudomonadota bacterium]
AGPLLLVVGQCGELFAQTAAPTERRALVQGLWRLFCQAAPLVRVIITLRVDFVGQCGELLVSPSGPRLDRVAFDEAHRVFIAQQEPAQLQQCIEQPADKVGLQLEAGLSAALLADVGNEPGALPLLEDALDMLWLRRQGGRLTHQAFAEIGGVVGALEKRADALVDALPAETQPLVRRLLTELVTVSEQGGSDTRRPQSLAELRSQIAADTTVAPEAVDALLHKLCHERLLVLTHSGNTAQVELAHEALIRRWRRLHTWLDEDRVALLAERRMQGDAERWQQQQQEASLLYRGAELLQAAAWRTARAQDGRRPSPLLATFLSASEAQEAAEAQQKQAAAQQLEAERQQKLRAAQTLARRTRQAAAVFAVLALVASGIGLVAWQQYKRARRQTELAIGVANTLVFNIDRRLQTVPGTSELRKEVLQDAAGLLDKLRPDSKDDPGLLQTRLAGHMQRGDLALTHDNVEIARQEYEQALQLSEKLAQANPHDAEAQRDLSITLIGLGEVAVQRGELAEAEAR